MLLLNATFFEQEQYIRKNSVLESPSQRCKRIIDSHLARGICQLVDNTVETMPQLEPSYL